MANEIKPIVPTDISPTDAVVGNLMSDLRQIIDEARIHVASTANYELTMMYWHIGERINRDVLGNERAEYGKQIVATVSRQLQNITVDSFTNMPVHHGKFIVGCRSHTDSRFVNDLAKVRHQISDYYIRWKNIG